MAAITSLMVDATCNAWATGALHQRAYDRIAAEVKAAEPEAVISTWSQVETVASKFPVLSQGITMRLLVTYPAVTRRLIGAFWERAWYDQEVAAAGFQDLDWLVQILTVHDCTVDVREHVAIAALAQARVMKLFQKVDKEATDYYICCLCKLLTA